MAGNSAGRAGSIHVMRALLLLALWSSPAGADRGPRPTSTTAATPGPALATLERQPTHAATNATTHGGFSGVIITPPPIADALPYPRGMVIAPPDTGDRMNLFVAPWASSPRALWQYVEGGLDTLWSALHSQTL
jgi:hypothetical protein